MRGQLVRGEADYQLHLIYLWYEKRSRDALALIRGLQARYPHNPLFYQVEADIHDVYFHDPVASLASSSEALTRATEGAVREPAVTAVRARFNIALQLDRLGRRRESIEALDRLIEERPSRPFGITDRARRERARLTSVLDTHERASSPRASRRSRHRDRSIAAHSTAPRVQNRHLLTTSTRSQSNVGENTVMRGAIGAGVDVRGRFALTTGR